MRRRGVALWMAVSGLAGAVIGVLQHVGEWSDAATFWVAFATVIALVVAVNREGLFGQRKPQRPAEADLARARSAAGTGRRLSDLIGEGRR